jgi:hypothetical protein
LPCPQAPQDLAGREHGDLVERRAQRRRGLAGDVQRRRVDDVEHEDAAGAEHAADLGRERRRAQRGRDVRAVEGVADHEVEPRVGALGQQDRGVADADAQPRRGPQAQVLARERDEALVDLDDLLGAARPRRRDVAGPACTPRRRGAARRSPRPAGGRDRRRRRSGARTGQARWVGSSRST